MLAARTCHVAIAVRQASAIDQGFAPFATRLGPSRALHFACYNPLLCKASGPFDNRARGRRPSCAAKAQRASSGEGGGGGLNNGGPPGEDDSGGLPQREPGLWKVLGALLTSIVGLLALLVVGSAAIDAWWWVMLPQLDTSNWNVSFIIPALNEEKRIGQLVQDLHTKLEPSALEIIVVDGGSSDRTVDEARKAGAKVVSGVGRGRGLQMNAGAAQAQGELLCFLHADTSVPPDMVDVLRHAFCDPRTVITGLTPCIQTNDGSKLHFMSAHNWIKTWYGPLLFRPLSYLHGLRLLFGDQAMAVRRKDFEAVGRFDGSIPIMEDAQLCLDLHAQGPEARGVYQGRGRVRMLVDHTAVTSGRRLAAYGNIRGTYIHAMLSTKWYFGAPPQELHELYRKLYTDLYR